MSDRVQLSYLNWIKGTDTGTNCALQIHRKRIEEDGRSNSRRRMEQEEVQRSNISTVLDVLMGLASRIIVTN